jgi:hypothetical protein
MVWQRYGTTVLWRPVRELHDGNWGMQEGWCCTSRLGDKRPLGYLACQRDGLMFDRVLHHTKSENIMCVDCSHDHRKVSNLPQYVYYCGELIESITCRAFWLINEKFLSRFHGTVVLWSNLFTLCLMGSRFEVIWEYHMHCKCILVSH